MAMDIEFDFLLHSDKASLDGTQYFEILPGSYLGEHWVEGCRFVDEYTFGLFEGVFEKHWQQYDHYGIVQVARPQWEDVLEDLAAFAHSLEAAGNSRVSLPYCQSVRIRDAFDQDFAANQRHLSALIASLVNWLRPTLAAHEVVSVLGI